MRAAAVPLAAVLAILALAPTAAARKAYVTRGSSVATLETTTNTPGTPAGLAATASDFVVFSPDARLAYVSTNTAAGVHVVDARTDTVVGTVATGPGTDPDVLALRPDGLRLYAA